MLAHDDFITGEFRRAVDDRHRITLPPEIADVLCGDADESECILAKERFGCLSLWNAARWREKIDQGIDLVKQKIRAGRLEGKLSQTQLFGRLLSTRYRPVKLAGRGRLVIPEGFREFLAVEPNSDVIVVGAAICVELWQPDAWRDYLKRRMPQFGSLFEELSS
jgi:MraZ protein